MKSPPINKHDKGAVLLMTLLIMSIMAAVAVSLMDDVRFALKRTANTDAYAQADWYLKGAEDYAQSYLSELVSQAEPSAFTAALAKAEPIILPLEGGSITLSVRDGSTCVSLGGLVQNDGRKLFRQLLEAAGWDSLSAANFTSIAADWVDADTQTLPGGAEDYVYLGLSPAYRTANAPFSTVGELRALSTMNTEKFTALKPFVCARESQETVINIDSLSPVQAPLLAAVLGGADEMVTAQTLIISRPPEGYQTLERLLTSPALNGRELSAEQIALLSFTPGHLWVEARVDYRNISRYAVIEFEIDGNKLTPIFKRLGTDARRPVMLKTPS